MLWVYLFFLPKTPFHIVQLSTNCIINNPNILTRFLVFLFSERNELCCPARVSNLGWNAVRAILIHVCWCSSVSLERCFVLIMIMMAKAAFTFCALKLDLSGFVCSEDLRFISWGHSLETHDTAGFKPSVGRMNIRESEHSWAFLQLLSTCLCILITDSSCQR